MDANNLTEREERYPDMRLITIVVVPPSLKKAFTHCSIEHQGQLLRNHISCMYKIMQLYYHDVAPFLCLSVNSLLHLNCSGETSLMDVTPVNVAALVHCVLPPYIQGGVDGNGEFS